MDLRTNFLQETLKALAIHGKGAGDVIWVGNKTEYQRWDEFAVSADFEYSAGFGGNEIDLNLKVVGFNWWLERGEYDGSEWWEYKSYPIKPRAWNANLKVKE